MLEVLRGYLRYFFSLLRHYRVSKLKMSWHLDGCPFAFASLSSCQSLWEEHKDEITEHWTHIMMAAHDTVDDLHFSSRAQHTSDPNPEWKKLLHSYKNANDVKLKSLIWIAEERAFQSWHFHRPSKEVGSLCGSVGSFVKPERLCRLWGGRWTELCLQNISEYNTDLSSMLSSSSDGFCLCWLFVWRRFITLIWDGKWVSCSSWQDQHV